jgi:hypothetical protein
LVISLVLLGFAASAPPDDPPYKNLKILAKNISHDDLKKIMDGYKEALGVKCNFCHAASKDTSVHHPDFASDDKPEKNIARKMMKMTAKINKKYFSFASAEEGENNPSVTCITCHRGNPQPSGKKPM